MCNRSGDGLPDEPSLLFILSFPKPHLAWQVPYLEDPNTNKAMFESAQIVKYLNETYALA